jgi:hypothetical protein
MATSLTFTSGPFMQATIATASIVANTKYTILSSDATNARRIYGISMAGTASIATATIWLNDGATSYQAFVVSVPANSGNSTSIAALDVQGSLYGAALFQKQRDANGVPYFNLPAGWSLQYSLAGTLAAGSSLSIIVFGETYA